MTKKTEHINQKLHDLELRDNTEILNTLAQSQLRGAQAADKVIAELSRAVDASCHILLNNSGRLVMVGAGASGRLAVQDGAELWPTYGWPSARLILTVAGGDAALLKSIEGCEDDSEDATAEVRLHNINQDDVVLGVAASGSSKWTVAWIEQARRAGALTIGIANNDQTPLLQQCDHPIFLDSGEEVLAGSTRMAAGTAQKAALNMFSTLLMIRLNRTYGNLMVDMAASNAKLDDRRLRMVQSVLPNIDKNLAAQALIDADGWVKLAVLIALGQNKQSALAVLEHSSGNLRNAIAKIKGN